MFLKYKSCVLALALSAGTTLAAEENPKVEIVPQLGHSASIQGVAIAPDGKTALSISEDKTLKLWDVASGRELRSFTGQAGPAAFSSDSTMALSASEANTLKLWDLASGRELKSFPGHADWVKSVALSPDGRLALSGSCDEGRSRLSLDCLKGSLKLWDVASGRELKSFSGLAGWIAPVAFSPDSKLAISGNCDERDRKKRYLDCIKVSLKLWDG
jgi:WD40 repeat protein